MSLENNRKFHMSTTGAMILMASVMVARGSSFIFSKWLMGDLAPVNILAVRFCIAFVILAIIFNKKMRMLNKSVIKKGFILGFLYTVDMIVEMYGLRLVDAGTCSFIENSAILIVPLYVSLMTWKLPRAKTMLCAAIAVVGIGFLTVSGGMHFNIGIIYVIAAALIFGVCIIVTDKVTEEDDPITIGILQVGFMGILSVIYTFIFESPVLPQNNVQWGMILMLALVCSCFGFTFQPLAQKYISAETAGVFTAVNPLTTCVLGILLHEESFDAFKIIGGVLIVAAVLLSVRTDTDTGDGSFVTPRED